MQDKSISTYKSITIYKSSNKSEIRAYPQYIQISSQTDEAQAISMKKKKGDGCDMVTRNKT